MDRSPGSPCPDCEESGCMRCESCSDGHTECACGEHECTECDSCDGAGTCHADDED